MAIALTFAQPVVPAEREQPDDEDEYHGLGDWSRSSSHSGWMRS